MTTLDGLENMGRDQLLLDQAERGQIGCRVYGWDGAWVSVGRFQSAERDLVSGSQVRWVRRPTGGKAVLHGHDVTVGLAAPLSVWPEADHTSVKLAYRAVVRPLIAALIVCGVDAVLAADSAYANRGSRSGDCFAFSSPNDVVDAESGRKLCGCAMRLTQSAVLLQASIPVRPPLVAPELVIVNGQAIAPVLLDEALFASALDDAVRGAW